MRARFTALLSLLVLGLTLNAGALSAQTVPVSRVCKDGTLSAVTGRGACTGHGGVDAKATEKARKAADRAALKSDKAAAKAEKKAEKREEKRDEKQDDRIKDARGATAQCKDGTYSHANTTRGACSSHGGIARTLKS